MQNKSAIRKSTFSSDSQISVVVLTYNASWEKVKATLNSVILQKGIKFELIISDDGSKNNHADKIKDFLTRYSFTNYIFLPHEKNQGTIKNFLDAVNHAYTNYVKAIGQGDMLSDEYVLRDLYEDFIETGVVMEGAGYASFRLVDSRIKLYRTPRMPQSPEVFRIGSIEQQKKAMLIGRDFMHGPTMIFKREVLAKYLNILADAGVKYTDDIVPWLMVADNQRVSYLDRLSVFYEADIGFSNYAGNLMQKDHDITYDLIIDRIKDTQPELSQTLKNLNSQYRKHRSMFERIKKALGIFSWLAVIPYLTLKAMQRILKGNRIIYTDTKASTEFAELCMTRE